MMKLATWLSIIALGPGSVAIFIWFLLDVKRIFGGGSSGMARRGDDEAKAPEAGDPH
jgi:hypothetical protein